MEDFANVAGKLPAVVRPQDEFRMVEYIVRMERVEVLGEILNPDEVADGEDPERAPSTYENRFKEVELRTMACKKGDLSVIELGLNLVRKGGDKVKPFVPAAVKKLLADWMVARDTDA